MPHPSPPPLSRRERQIMDVLYARGEATAADVREAIADPPSNSAIRGLLRVLVEKGHLQHRQDGPRYVYTPRLARDKARKSALAHLLRTFFGGSAEDAVTALLDLKSQSLSEEELGRIAKRIEEARREGR